MLRPGDKFDKYRIVRKLGEGGMALVYLAESPFGLQVVLKILSPTLKGEPEVLERFRREGRIQYTLRHPYIVRVTDIVEDYGVPALVVDYMRGEDLEVALRAQRLPDFNDVLEISAKMLDALQCAHEHGFIHRDIKPSNIYLERVDGGGVEPRLCDFGIAKIQEAAALTRAQEFCGTPNYASPEQIESTRDVDPRTDVYSFGLVMWEMLAGHEPYSELGHDPFRIMIAVVREPLPALPDTVPPWLRQVIEIATAKDPKQRFATARQFKEALIRGASTDPSLKGAIAFEEVPVTADQVRANLPGGQGAQTARQAGVAMAMVVRRPAGDRMAFASSLPVDDELPVAEFVAEPSAPPVEPPARPRTKMATPNVSLDPTSGPGQYAPRNVPQGPGGDPYARTVGPQSGPVFDLGADETAPAKVAGTRLSRAAAAEMQQARTSSTFGAQPVSRPSGPVAPLSTQHAPPPPVAEAPAPSQTPTIVPSAAAPSAQAQAPATNTAQLPVGGGPRSIDEIPTKLAPTLGQRAARLDAREGLGRLKLERLKVTSGTIAVLVVLLLTAAWFGWRMFSSSRAVPPGFVRIEAGSFTMGSPAAEPGRMPEETERRIRISRPFAMKVTEVTRAEYARIMSNLPGQFGACGDNCPVVSISWFDAIEFCNRLSRLDGLDQCYEINGSGPTRTVSWPDGTDCRGYRLPTEAEWEYAARAGTSSAFSSGPLTVPGRGATDPALEPIAWYGGNSDASYAGAVECAHWGEGRAQCGLQPTAAKQPNPLGLHDIHGNAAEWVWDWYGPYEGTAATDPMGPQTGTQHVVRGGSWQDTAELNRSAARVGMDPLGRFSVGFRIVRSL
jgi:serine/threonine-protein kinase